MRTNCCLSLPPPTSNASLVPIKPPHVSLVKNEGNWRRHCFMMGVASIIGLEMCNSVTAVAIRLGEEESNYSSVSVGGAKWSEKRTCPPWRGNSLETIVPENLPRPAARRRYEAVRSNSKTAPPLSPSIKLTTTNKGSCFSM